MKPPTYQITIDCADPDAMARFWAEALHYQLQPPPHGHKTWTDYWVSVGVEVEDVDGEYDSIIDPDGVRPRIWFQQVPETKTIKNRIHFDLLIGGGRAVDFAQRKELVQAEADRLMRLGAQIGSVHEDVDQGNFFIAMLDPENNEFDVA